MRILAQKSFIAFLALSLLGGWTVQASMSCSGPCCAAPTARAELPRSAAPMTLGAMQGCCCCGGEQAPCDLERAPLPEQPPRALSAVPKIEAPNCGVAAASVVTDTLESTEPGTPHWGRDPPGLPPPSPLYLEHDSFLC